ncbi:hypothetical protein POM88_020962 [Heracleum sosnowskyi]|uniref:Uncharacterized protein n=1 Tax=Heracleum sosnowskyi TaxID=360622 RepID=A0AAD8ICC9_9APIA|nr:hypothetical protein POM88_020962 [Heracleum sosnowskyi]
MLQITAIELNFLNFSYLEGSVQTWQRKNDLDEDFSFILSLDFITKDVDELKQMIIERKENRQNHVVKVINRKCRRNLDNSKGHEECRLPTQKSGRKNEDSEEALEEGHKKRINQILTFDDELKQSEDHIGTNMVTAHKDDVFVKDKGIEILECWTNDNDVIIICMLCLCLL